MMVISVCQIFIFHSKNGGKIGGKSREKLMEKPSKRPGKRAISKSQNRKLPKIPTKFHVTNFPQKFSVNTHTEQGTPEHQSMMPAASSISEHVAGITYRHTAETVS